MRFSVLSHLQPCYTISIALEYQLGVWSEGCTHKLNFKPFVSNVLNTMLFLDRNLTYPTESELLLFSSWVEMFKLAVADTCAAKLRLRFCRYKCLGFHLCRNEKRGPPFMRAQINFFSVLFSLFLHNHDIRWKISTNSVCPPPPNPYNPGKLIKMLCLTPWPRR